jgi:hypothetical protein
MEILKVQDDLTDIDDLPYFSQAVVPIEEIEKHEAWLRERNGKFTASGIYRLCSYENKPDELSAGAETYVMEKVLEILTDGESRKDYINAAMERGNQLETEAVQIVENILLIKFDKTGDNQEFVPYGSHAGATPDGISTKAGLEIKCPDCKTHFEYLNINNQYELKRLKPQYYWQIQTGMLCTGLKLWYFASYDPRFTETEKQLKIIKIEQDEKDLNLLKLRLKKAIERKLELLKQ